MIEYNIEEIYTRYATRKRPIEFEYDPAKSASNAEKHGIDFEQAKELWQGKTKTVTIVGDFGEKRYAVLGMLGENYWTAIITFRETRIRIISVRRSRAKEVAFYDAQED